MSRNCVCLRFSMVFLVLVVAVSSVLAGEQLFLEKGSRVRITLIEPSIGSLLEPKRIEGRLLGLTTMDITLATSAGGRPKVIPSDNIEKVELCSQRGRRLKGALVGGGIGAASGFLYGLIFVGDTSDNPNDWGGGTAAETGAAWSVLLAPVGALIGALVAPGERWQVVQSDRLQLGIDCYESGQGGVFITMGF